MIDELLNFIRLNLEKIESNKVFWNINYAQDINFEDKIYLESSVALMLYHRNNKSSLNKESYLKIQCDIKSFVEKDEYALKLIKKPYLLYNYGLIYISLKKCGYTNSRLDAIIDFIEKKNLFDTIETIPFRVLDIEWSKHLLHNTEVKFDIVSKTSILNKKINPAYITTNEAYAFTHSIFYLTDFGVKEMPKEINLKSLRKTINALISWALFNEDLDVLAELVISIYCIYNNDDRHSKFAYDILCKYYSDFGFLPSKGFITSTYQNLTNKKEKEAYAYKNIYHTNYVWFLLLIIKNSRNLKDHTNSNLSKDEKIKSNLNNTVYFLNKLNLENGIITQIKKEKNILIIIEVLLLKSISKGEIKILKEILDYYKNKVEYHSIIYLESKNYLNLWNLN